MIKPDQRIGATCMCPVYYTFHAEEANKAEGTICQAKVKTTLPSSEIINTVINCDACSSKDVAAKHMLHNVKSCAHYNQQPIRLTTANGVTPWFKEMGILKLSLKTPRIRMYLSCAMHRRKGFQDIQTL